MQAIGLPVYNGFHHSFPYNIYSIIAFVGFCAIGE